MDATVLGQRTRIAPLTWNEIAVAMGVPERNFTDAIAHLVAAEFIESARQPAGFIAMLRGGDNTTFFFAT